MGQDTEENPDDTDTPLAEDPVPLKPEVDPDAFEDGPKEATDDEETDFAFDAASVPTGQTVQTNQVCTLEEWHPATFTSADAWHTPEQHLYLISVHAPPQARPAVDQLLAEIGAAPDEVIVVDPRRGSDTALLALDTGQPAPGPYQVAIRNAASTTKVVVIDALEADAAHISLGDQSEKQRDLNRKRYDDVGLTVVVVAHSSNSNVDENWLEPDATPFLNCQSDAAGLTVQNKDRLVEGWNSGHYRTDLTAALSTADAQEIESALDDIAELTKTENKNAYRSNPRSYVQNHFANATDPSIRGAVFTAAFFSYLAPKDFVLLAKTFASTPDITRPTLNEQGEEQSPCIRIDSDLLVNLQIRRWSQGHRQITAFRRGKAFAQGVAEELRQIYAPECFKMIQNAAVTGAFSKLNRGAVVSFSKVLGTLISDRANGERISFVDEVLAIVATVLESSSLRNWSTLQTMTRVLRSTVDAAAASELAPSVEIARHMASDLVAKSRDHAASDDHLILAALLLFDAVATAETEDTIGAILKTANGLPPLARLLFVAQFNPMWIGSRATLIDGREVSLITHVSAWLRSKESQDKDYNTTRDIGMDPAICILSILIQRRLAQDIWKGAAAPDTLSNLPATLISLVAEPPGGIDPFAAAQNLGTSVNLHGWQLIAERLPISLLSTFGSFAHSARDINVSLPLAYLAGIDFSDPQDHLDELSSCFGSIIADMGYRNDPRGFFATFRRAAPLIALGAAIHVETGPTHLPDLDRAARKDFKDLHAWIKRCAKTARENLYSTLLTTSTPKAAIRCRNRGKARAELIASRANAAREI